MLPSFDHVTGRSYGPHGPKHELLPFCDDGAVRAARSSVDWIQGEDRSTYPPGYLHPSSQFTTLLILGEGDRLYIGTSGGNLSVYSVAGSEGTYCSS